jgi:hypothetical protein
MKKFRTGRSNGCAVLRTDGTLLHMAPNPESADLLCLVLNSENISRNGIFENEKFTPTSSIVKMKMALVKDGEASFSTNKEKMAFHRGVSHALNNLIKHGFLINSESIQLQPNDKDIEDAAKKLLSDIQEKGFMGGIDSLTKLMNLWHKKGRIVMIDEREVDIGLLLRKDFCRTCNETGMIDEKNRIACLECNGTAEVDPSMTTIRERYASHYGKPKYERK